jgi:diguanylate cyclase (GGDEF)-like protein
LNLHFFRSFQGITFLLICIVGSGITYATYIAISNIVAQQSRIQQQAVSPVFSLVNEELLKPLHVAQTIGLAKNFDTLLDTTELDEPALVSLLRQLESQFGLTFFVASEKMRKQYLSSGKQIELLEGKVFWYFEAQQQDRELIADLGQVGNVHLYFDVKISNKDGEFLGFVGVGKSLQQFIDTFDQYKQTYGYDFLFVNDKDQIILTSLPDLVVTGAHIPTLDTLPWYTKEASASHQFESSIVNDKGKDFLLSKIDIEELDWKLILLVPLDARQAQITNTFVTNTLMSISVMVFLFVLAFWVMVFYKNKLERSGELDPLTQLPNRAFIHHRYQQLKRQDAMISVIMVDIDRFKDINDNYGHNTGDEVLRTISRIMTEEIREQDTVGRWGGEEFIMLIPTTSEQTALSIAERTRQCLELETFIKIEDTFKVTASFGVTHGSSRIPLTELIASADAALYEAKKRGRNTVKFSLTDITE